MDKISLYKLLLPVHRLLILGTCADISTQIEFVREDGIKLLCSYLASTFFFTFDSDGFVFYCTLNLTAETVELSISAEEGVPRSLSDEEYQRVCQLFDSVFRER